MAAPRKKQTATSKSPRKTQPKKKPAPRAEVGILGGTGLYEIEGIEDVREVKLRTPFGSPTDAYIVGRLAGKTVAFLSRHGRGHKYLPADVNFRANIYGFKMLGVERIISVNSCGSLKLEIKPRDIVLSDQFFDRTRRPNTFFTAGIAGHIGFANPVCGDLVKVLFEAGQALGIKVIPKGTYICIEGPAFSTKAESRIYRSWGCDVIGMTAATEARLCREAGICYATMNLVTDYDVWHESEETVSVELILANLRANIDNAKAIIKKALGSIAHQKDCDCGCQDALTMAIVTAPKAIPAALKKKLDLIIGNYIKK
jgi:5'-methylthioadenosine phosphorylase